MKCPMCGGIGLTDLHTPNVGRCIKCNGSGEIEPTNEEWLRTCSTEELAETLKEMTDKCATCELEEYDLIKQCPFGICRNGVNEFIEWLNQPHKE